MDKTHEQCNSVTATHRMPEKVSEKTGTQVHYFQNRTGPGGRIVKTGNRDENRFFKPKEPDFLLIP